MDGFIWWVREYWQAVLTVVVSFAVLGAISAHLSGIMHRPPVHEEATVLRFGAYATKGRPGALVVVRLADGTVRQLHVDERRTRRCKVGSRIHIVRRGNATTVRPQGCVDLPEDGRHDATL